MSVLVNSMLKGEGRMDSAKLWPVACLGGRPQSTGRKGSSPRRKANGRKTKGESLAKGSDLHHFHREWWRLQSNAAITPIVQSRHYQTDKYQHVITVAVS